jgi:hypothetical protein
LPGFLKRTIESLRTGFYLQVLKCGTAQAGDTWHLKSRPNAWLTLHAVNVCYYQMPLPEMVDRILATPELAEGWKRMFGEKLSLDQGELARRLVSEGKSVREIASVFNVHPATIYRLAAT